MFDLTARVPADDCEKDKAAAGCPDDAVTTAGINFTYPLDEAAAKAKAAADKKAAAIVAWQEQQKTPEGTDRRRKAEAGRLLRWCAQLELPGEG